MSIPALPEYALGDVTLDHGNKPGWQLDPDRAVLLIHDMQRYFLSFYGENSTLVNDLGESVKQLKQWCVNKGIPCAYTAQPGGQNPRERALLTDFWGEGLADDENFTGIASVLAPAADDAVFTKWRYSAFKKNNFDKWLRALNRDQIIICGVYGHIGILSTALEAFMLDYQPFVVGDAMADFSLEEHQHTLAYVASRCGVITDLNTLTANALTPEVQQQSTHGNAFYSEDAVAAQVANILYEAVEDIPTGENLQSYGLDSIRLITLLEAWQAEGVLLDFAEFASNMTVKNWASILLREARREGVDGAVIGNGARNAVENVTATTAGTAA